jgi:hypothetical protein
MWEESLEVTKARSQRLSDAHAVGDADSKLNAACSSRVFFSCLSELDAKMTEIRPELTLLRS